MIVRKKYRLAEVIANIANLTREHYTPIDPKDSVQQQELDNAISAAGFVCSCFLAQGTVHGANGVGYDEPIEMLKMDKDMPIKERLKLAEAFIEELDGELDKAGIEKNAAHFETRKDRPKR